jgi:hypothetical protein
MKIEIFPLPGLFSWAKAPFLRDEGREVGGWMEKKEK